MGRDPSTCVWCPEEAISRMGSVQLCPKCQRGVNATARNAFERQKAESLSNYFMGNSFGMAADTWTKLRRLMAADPTADVLTIKIDPNHPVFRPGAPEVKPVRDRHWQHRSKCANDDEIHPDFFFPTSEKEKAVVRDFARVYCGDCPVETECRESRRRDEGVWGGKYYRGVTG